VTRIKICGLSRPQDIEYANQLAPDYIGFVFAESRRRVTPEQAARLREGLREGIVPVGVFVNAPPEAVAGLLEDGTIDMAQLHGAEDEAYLARLRRLTEKPVIKAFSVRSSADLARALAASADYILLDNGAGGTGESFDWSLLRGFPRPFFLAGGLTPETAREAIDAANPFAVDVSSGVETGGVKDFEKMRRFAAAVREG